MCSGEFHGVYYIKSLCTFSDHVTNSSASDQNTVGVLIITAASVLEKEKAYPASKMDKQQQKAEAIKQNISNLPKGATPEQRATAVKQGVNSVKK